MKIYNDLAKRAIRARDRATENFEIARVSPGIAKGSAFGAALQAQGIARKLAAQAREALKQEQAA